MVGVVEESGGVGRWGVWWVLMDRESVGEGGVVGATQEGLVRVVGV